MLTVIGNYSKDTIIKQYHVNSWNWTIIYYENTNNISYQQFNYHRFMQTLTH